MKWCGNLAASMECHGERSVDTGHSHGVPSEVGVVGKRHTSGVLLGISVDLWSVCIKQMRRTVEMSFAQ